MCLRLACSSQGGYLGHAESSAALQTQLSFTHHISAQARARGKSLWKKELKSCAHPLAQVCCSCCEDPPLEAPAWKIN